MPEFNPDDYTWQRVDIRPGNQEHGPTYYRWSEDAKYCLKSGRNCDKCTLWTHYGFRWQNPTGLRDCWIPEAVQQLLDSGVGVPGSTAPHVPMKYQALDPAVTRKVSELAWVGLTAPDIRARLSLPWALIDRYITAAAIMDGYPNGKKWRAAITQALKKNRISEEFKQKHAAII